MTDAAALIPADTRGLLPPSTLLCCSKAAVLRVESPATTSSITWEPVRNKNSQAPPQT